MRKWIVLTTILLTSTLAASSATVDETAPEPNVATASAWWPDLTNVWTPIGWRDHLFRFNVVYDGTILAMARPENTIEFTAPWTFNAAQVGFAPSLTGEFHPTRMGTPYQLTRDMSRRAGNQGWTPGHDAPVLWTEWRQPDSYMDHFNTENGGRWPGDVI